MTNNQVDILLHTWSRAADGMYCGNSMDMQVLVKLGFMRPAGTVPGVPDPYFCLTDAGMAAVQVIETSRKALSGIPAEFLQDIPKWLRPLRKPREAVGRAGFEVLKNAPRDGNPSVYVSIHHGIGGWNSAVWGWEADPAMAAGGFYQPLNSGTTNTLGTGTREEAVEEATGWAQSDELPLWIPEDTR